MDSVEKYTVWSIDDGARDAVSIKLITTPEQQVELLKGKGVTFERCAEGRALDILTSGETYLHLSAYRVLFQRHEDGPHAGKFVNLDFGDLLDVSCFDDALRETFRLLAKDVERTIRARLVSEAAGRGEDGYGIVADFASSLPRRFREGLRRELISRSQADEYAGSLIDHYRDAMPVWVLLEVVPFGTLLAFYLFCVERWDEESRREIHYALKNVKAIRNCASHAGCLCNGFLHDTLAGDNAAPAALDAVAGLRPLMDEAMWRYGTQNPSCRILCFSRGFLMRRSTDVMMCTDAKTFEVL
ncbi:Abi family protein [Collinsella intestinalis]|nr:Abi family protein [Collinsella intestinalis]